MMLNYCGKTNKQPGRTKTLKVNLKDLVRETDVPLGVTNPGQKLYGFDIAKPTGEG